MGVGGQRHAPAALRTGMTCYPLYRRLGRAQSLSGRVLETSPQPRFDPRTVQLVANCYIDYAIPAQIFWAVQYQVSVRCHIRKDSR